MPAALRKDPNGVKSIREQLLAVNQGYPLSYARTLMSKVTKGNTALQRRILSQATMTRLKKPGSDAVVLKKDLSEKLARIERIWARALAIYQGDENDASDFMLRPHMMLDGKSPFEMTLEGETSALFVSSVLATIEHGYAA